MAWDFSTEPEFEEKLEWMRGFMRDEIIPLETLDLDAAAFERATAPLKEEVKARGLWAAHLPPELGGGGFGQVKLGLMHEILGQCVYAPSIFGNNAPDSGNAELLAVGANEEQKKKWLQPLLDGRLRSAFSMTEPGAGADPTLLKTRAERVGDDYVINGHKWFTSNGSVADFLIVMAVTDPDGPPRRRASMFIVPAGTPRSSTGTCGFRRRTSSATRATASCSPSSGSGPAGSTTACAGSGSPSGRSTCSASAPSRGTPTARCSRTSRWCRTGSPPPSPR